MASSPARVPIPRRGVDYRGKVVLAPMVRSGELPSRLQALNFGADLVWGPETIDKAIAGAVRKVCLRTNTVIFTRKPNHGHAQPAENTPESIIYRIHPEREGKKLIFQLGTASPETAVLAARVVAQDVAGIDVNSGCPKPFSTLGGMGAALLKDPDRLVSILEALVKEIASEYEIGISVKIRLLDDPADTETLVRRLVKTGITGLTIHCRTTPMRPREKAIREQLRMIVDVCHEAGVACVMNGDVENRDQAVQLMEEFGADGAMIATAAEKNPSVFRAGKPLGWREVARDYIVEAMNVENRWANTKFLLAQLVFTKDSRYGLAQTAKTHEQMVTILGFDDLLERAKEADARLGLLPDRKKLSKKEKKAVRQGLVTPQELVAKNRSKRPVEETDTTEQAKRSRYEVQEKGRAESASVPTPLAI